MSGLVQTRFSIIAFPKDEGCELVCKNEDRTRVWSVMRLWLKMQLHKSYYESTDVRT